MSLSYLLTVQKEENVVFDDIAAMNQDLRESEAFSEFFMASHNRDDYDFITQAPTACSFGLFKAGDIAFTNFYEYGNVLYRMVETWGMFNEEVAQIIANHMIGGTVVFRVDIEGNDPEWYKCVPGKAAKVEPTF